MNAGFLAVVFVGLIAVVLPTGLLLLAVWRTGRTGRAISTVMGFLCCVFALFTALAAEGFEEGIVLFLAIQFLLLLLITFAMAVFVVIKVATANLLHRH